MTISERLRRDPQKGKKEFSAHKGFTVIELMIAVAVLAIITSLALPSYRAIIEKRQVTSGAERLSAFLGSVQLEAVKRNENVTVSYATGADNTWCIGIVSGLDACDCMDTNTDTADCKIDGALRVINESNVKYAGVVNAVNGDGSFVFDPARGLVFDDSNMAAYDTAEWELLSDGGKYALNVFINQAGRVRLCSDSTDNQVPGYELCAN